MQHVSLDRSLLIRESAEASGEALWAAFLKKAAAKYPKVVVLLFTCLEKDLTHEYGSALASGIDFVECFDEELEPEHIMSLVDRRTDKRSLVAFDSLDHLLPVWGVNKTARFLEDIKDRDVPVICRTLSPEVSLDSIVDAILDVKPSTDSPQAVVCHSTCFQKNGKRVQTAETFDIDENLNLKASKVLPKTIEEHVAKIEAENGQDPQMPNVSFNMGLKLKASEMEAKQKVNLPFMEAQKVEGLVGLNITQGKKIRAGGQIIYTPDDEDDFDDSDPDDDLMMGKLGMSRDPKLQSRIGDILNEKDKPEGGYDSDEIALKLQQRFPEYARQKKQPFVKMVEAIVNTQNSQKKSRKRKGGDLEKIEPDEIVLDGSDMDTDDVEPNYPKTNTANKSIRSLYAKGKPESVKPPEANAEGKSQKKKKGGAAAPPGGLQGTMKSRGLGSVPVISVEVEVPKIKFADLGGCQSQFLEVCRLSMHLKHPELHEKLGVIPPTGILLHGPPGCGKTLFAQAVSGELGIPLLKVATTELVSGVSGESEEKIRVLFARAVEEAPCVLLLDEIDAIAPKRENATREMERRIVTQLLSSLDDLTSPVKEEEKAELRFDKDGGVSIAEPKEDESKKAGKQYVLVIGTTNRPEAIETALRRAGRFDKEIALGIPDERARTEILDIVCRGLRADESVVMSKIARLTPGYVGADLRALAREASMCAVNRIFETIVVPSGSNRGRQTFEETCEELNRMVAWLNSDAELDSDKVEKLFVTVSDFERALSIVSPSAKREGFATVPDVTWDEIGALSEVRSELEWSILFPIKRPEDFAVLSISTKPQGILLCGPPGCGKTLLAKAVANETGMNFISVKGPELLSMYVGESERAVRTVFQRARDSSPCVIFFDEIDALCPKRSGNESTGGARLVNQLLTEMDGIEGRKQVYMIGATNRPDIVDPAILRPGRLDKILFVDFPNAEDRADIMRKSTKNGSKPRVSPDFSFETFAARPELDYYTGADLTALIHEASVVALKERLSMDDSSIDSLTTKHFEIALGQIRPSSMINSSQEECKGFATASGRTIEIRPEALQRAQQKMLVTENEENESEADLPAPVPNNASTPVRNVSFSRISLNSKTTPVRTPGLRTPGNSQFRSPLTVNVARTPTSTAIGRTPTTKSSKFRSPLVRRDDSSSVLRPKPSPVPFNMPKAHPFSFPFPPYDIQRQLMEAMTSAISARRVGIFESPTGTGKSLSTICAVLTWLKEFEANRRSHLDNNIRKYEQDERSADVDTKTSKDWIGAAKAKFNAKKERETLEDEAESLRKVDNRLKEAREGRAKKSFDGRKRKFDGDEDEEDSFAVPLDPSPSDDVDTDLLPTDDTTPNTLDEPDDKPLRCTKIYYASRTHSQLEQFLEEIRKTSFEPRVVQLASRQALCVNDEVKALKNLSLMNERCMEMRKAKSTSQKMSKTDENPTPSRRSKKQAICKCEFAKSEAVEDLADMILATDRSVKDIEALAKTGRDMTACAYFASRKAQNLCEVVLLPYQILLHQKTRSIWGVDVKDNVVVIDEAHNLLSTVADIHSEELTLPALTVGLSLVREYIDKYKARLNPSNLKNIEELLKIIVLLEKKLTEISKGEKDVVYSMTAFITDLSLYNFDLYEVLSYMERTNMCSKFHGFFKRYCGRVGTQKEKNDKVKLTGVALMMKQREDEKNGIVEDEGEEVSEEQKPRMSSPMYQIVSFIEALTNRCSDARLLLKRENSSAGTPPTYRFILLNPAEKLKDLVKDARSVLLIGGTMEPSEQLVDAFERVCEVPKDSIARFSCGHVVDDSQLAVISLGRAPNGHDFTLTYANRSTPQTVAAIGMTLMNMLRQIPNGVVVFFASYDYMSSFITSLKSNNMYDRINNIKPIFVERRGASNKLWTDYSKQARTAKGAMLCAVVGGKLSEGINFSDELGRCVIMIGLPYPNKNSVELQEKMKYLDEFVRPGAGSAHYEACCMHAVNQAIGRAIRHRNDYAAIVLLDSRYAKPHVSGALPKWIAGRLTHCESFPPALQKIVGFFKERKREI